MRRSVLAFYLPEVTKQSLWDQTSFEPAMHLSNFFTYCLQQPIIKISQFKKKVLKIQKTI